MEKNHCYDLYMNVLFHLRGKALIPQKANGLLREFRKQLEDFRFENDRFFICPSKVDEFQSELVKPNLVICSQQMLLHIWAGSSYAGSYPSEVLPILHKEMMKQYLDNGQKYSKKISIKMVNTNFPGDVKRGRWPAENYERTRM